ncbi:hypothetical protein NDU88_003124 [Pleurodeles waltl]|uniref:Uncharacterized protein n=1 Tax=Pleurodeles waltl TaxID=8319 RepID=A0AAV7UY45_PLEWA|nr:hypothetical protein NDU88_003124 [Pleurodeles waltl]
MENGDVHVPVRAAESGAVLAAREFASREAPQPARGRLNGPVRSVCSLVLGPGSFVLSLEEAALTSASPRRLGASTRPGCERREAGAQGLMRPRTPPLTSRVEARPRNSAVFRGKGSFTTRQQRPGLLGALLAFALGFDVRCPGDPSVSRPQACQTGPAAAAP